MRIVREAWELGAERRPACVAIGMFDGVHLGHQQVLHQTLADAEAYEGLAIALTFDRHPSSVVAPERAPPLIYSLDYKLHVLSEMGLDATLLLPFERELSRLSAEDFIRNLVHDLGQLKSLCVGGNFSFGYKRSGNVDLLRQLGRELNFKVHGLAAVALDGRVVSSTRIRESIRQGDFETANQMLGRTYALSGPVIHGDGLGRRLGIPTANMDVHPLVVPPHGVYAVHVHRGASIHRGVLNIGLRPTLQLPEPALHAEVHLLEFEGDLYGQTLGLTFVQRIRDEKRFGGLEDLVAQIHKDIRQAQSIFASLA